MQDVKAVVIWPDEVCTSCCAVPDPELVAPSERSNRVTGALDVTVSGRATVGGNPIWTGTVIVIALALRLMSWVGTPATCTPNRSVVFAGVNVSAVAFRNPATNAWPTPSWTARSSVTPNPVGIAPPRKSPMSVSGTGGLSVGLAPAYAPHTCIVPSPLPVVRPSTTSA